MIGSGIKPTRFIEGSDRFSRDESLPYSEYLGYSSQEKGVSPSYTPTTN